MEQERTVIGVDLGGTNMRAALVKDRIIMKHAQRLVPKTNDPMKVVEELTATIKEVLTPEVTAIGIGVPSLVGYDTGIVYDVTNIPSWTEMPLKKILSKTFNLPVFINNDANCFAVGERVYGEGIQFENFVGLITGTGMGGGIIKDGRLMQDMNCGSGEFGMMPYLDHDYEYYCSGQFFTNTYGVSGEEMAQRAKAGDVQAIEAYNTYGRHLGKGIKAILYAVDPEAIIIGGSVSKSFSLYEKAMWEEIKTFPFRITLEKIRILPSNLAEVAIYGAAALCINNLYDRKAI